MGVRVLCALTRQNAFFSAKKEKTFFFKTKDYSQIQGVVLIYVLYLSSWLLLLANLRACLSIRLVLERVFFHE